MAHFRGTVAGTRGTASRLGTKNSGVTVEAQSWEGKVTVSLSVKNGRDWAIVRLARHHGAGTDMAVYAGPVSGMDAQDGRIGPTRPLAQRDTVRREETS